MLIILELFVMLVLANGTPVVAARLLKNRWSAPVDGDDGFFRNRTFHIHWI